jgi:hypothetical protein
LGRRDFPAAPTRESWERGGIRGLRANRGAAVQLHESGYSSRTHATLTMSERTALSRRAETVVAQQTAQVSRLSEKPSHSNQLLAEMAIVEADIGAAPELNDTLGHSFEQASAPPEARSGTLAMFPEELGTRQQESQLLTSRIPHAACDQFQGSHILWVSLISREV